MTADMGGNSGTALEHNIALGKRAGAATGLIGAAIGGPLGCWLLVHSVAGVAVALAIVVVVTLEARALGGKLGGMIDSGAKSFGGGLVLALAALVTLSLMLGLGTVLTSSDERGPVPFATLFGFAFYACFIGGLPALVLGLVFGGWFQVKRAK